MNIHASLIDSSLHRWHGKVVTAADRHLDRHFSDLLSTCSAWYTARFLADAPKAAPMVRLGAETEEPLHFELTFNTSEWETADQAIPLAIPQLLGALIALAVPLGISQDLLLERCRSLSIVPATMDIQAPSTPSPAAPVHPRAREILKDEIFWELTDDYGPVGSDTGADVYGMYQEWRADNPPRNRDEFFTALMEEWDCPASSPSTFSEEEIRAELEADDFAPLTWDDSVIAFAVAQIAFDGALGKAWREEALLSIRRQFSPAVLEFRGWTSQKQRRAVLEKVRNVLQTAPLDAG